MKQEFDDIALSSYVDGELDPESMQTIEALIENDSNARKYIINAIRTTARLRGSYNKVLYEEIPESLTQTIISRPNKRRYLSPVFRIAAAISLIVLGFGARSLITVNGDRPLTALITPFPASFNRVVTDAMEHNLSGAPRQWQSPENNFVVTVTPVRTYRDKNGKYLREYRMEVNSASQRLQINGLAYRLKGEWKTKAVYYQ